MSSERFRYEGYELDAATGTLECRYSLGSWRFREEIVFDLAERTGTAARAPAGALDEAARLVHLLAGVSYYKTAAPPVVDLGPVATTPAERAFLRMFLVEGLGEFAYRNGLDLTGITLTGPDRHALPTAWDRPAAHPLVPFGAGIDSIVTAEAVRETHPALTLFVVGRGGVRFEAIERTLQVAGLPVARAERHIDPAVLRSQASGFLNGHVPVTGIISSIAVLAAVLGGHGSVVMSNEWSASAATTEIGGRAVNHQWSKGWAFETAFRDVLAGALAPPPQYFSFLRARSELWVARRFAALGRYHGVFRSCNRAFYTDPAQRLDHWCGTCDKCCFIDLVLSPFLAAGELGQIFGGHEPLGTASLEPAFRSLIGVGTEPRPFECVGDVHECRAAAVLAAERADRAGCTMLHDLAAWAREAGASGTDALFEKLGPDAVPEAFARRAAAGATGRG